MTGLASLDTVWSRRMRVGDQPSRQELLDHLLEVHRRNAGFTESCAQRCRDDAGRNSYEWLADVVDPKVATTVLDLACGSGVLLDLLHRRHAGRLSLIGIDVSAEELALARDRLPGAAVTLHRTMAQDLAMVPDDGVDAVLCHWALTLMDPVEPVLREIGRVLRPGGVFAAIVDGAMESAPGYAAINELIYGWVQREFPLYGAVELGDSRVRTAEGLIALIGALFPDAEIAIEPGVVHLTDPPMTLAREAAGFFYSSFVLSGAAQAAMLEALADLLEAQARGGQAQFAMPINRLRVRLSPKTGEMSDG